MIAFDFNNIMHNNPNYIIISYIFPFIHFMYIFFADKMKKIQSHFSSWCKNLKQFKLTLFSLKIKFMKHIHVYKIKKIPKIIIITYDLISSSHP